MIPGRTWQWILLFKAYLVTRYSKDLTCRYLYKGSLISLIVLLVLNQQSNHEEPIITCPNYAHGNGDFKSYGNASKDRKMAWSWHWIWWASQFHTLFWWVVRNLLSQSEKNSTAMWFLYNVPRYFLSFLPSFSFDFFPTKLFYLDFSIPFPLIWLSYSFSILNFSCLFYLDFPIWTFMSLFYIEFSKNWKGYLPNLLETALLCQIFVL